MSTDRILLKAIRLANMRVFEGEHSFPVADGLTVLLGRNNAGKSTALRAPFAYFRSGPEWRLVRSDPATSELGLQLQVPTQVVTRLFSVPNAQLALKGVMDSDPLKPRSLHLARQFQGWAQRPMVEVAVRGTAQGSVVRRVRFVGMEGAYAQIDVNGLISGDIEGMLQLREPGHLRAALSMWDDFWRPERLAFWEHHSLPEATGWIEQHQRRVVDTNEKRLLEVLTFLRLKHAPAFDALADGFQRAFPEFARLDFIDGGSEFSYRPGFAGVSASPLAREQIGSGAWAYLCILTAARAAKATGATVLMLDEPHLYLHPALERHLLEELLDAEKWDGAPLQVIAATHSPRVCQRGRGAWCRQRARVGGPRQVVGEGDLAREQPATAGRDPASW